MTGMHPTRCLADEADVIAALSWAIEQCNHQQSVVMSPRSGISRRIGEQMCKEYRAHARALWSVVEERKARA